MKISNMWKPECPEKNHNLRRGSLQTPDRGSVLSDNRALHRSSPITMSARRSYFCYQSSYGKSLEITTGSENEVPLT